MARATSAVRRTLPAAQTSRAPWATISGLADAAFGICLYNDFRHLDQCFAGDAKSIRPIQQAADQYLDATLGAPVDAFKKAGTWDDGSEDWTPDPALFITNARGGTSMTDEARARIYRALDEQPKFEMGELYGAIAAAATLPTSTPLARRQAANAALAFSAGQFVGAELGHAILRRFADGNLKPYEFTGPWLPDYHAGYTVRYWLERNKKPLVSDSTEGFARLRRQLLTRMGQVIHVVQLRGIFEGQLRAIQGKSLQGERSLTWSLDGVFYGATAFADRLANYVLNTDYHVPAVFRPK